MVFSPHVEMDVGELLHKFPSLPVLVPSVSFQPDAQVVWMRRLHIKVCSATIALCCVLRNLLQEQHSGRVGVERI